MLHRQENFQKPRSLHVPWYFLDWTELIGHKKNDQEEQQDVDEKKK